MKKKGILKKLAVGVLTTTLTLGTIPVMGNVGKATIGEMVVQAAEVMPDYDTWLADTCMFGFEGQGNSLYKTLLDFQDPVYLTLGDKLIEDDLTFHLSSAWNSCLNGDAKKNPNYLYEVIIMDYLKFSSKSDEFNMEMVNNVNAFAVEIYSAIADELGNTLPETLSKYSVKDMHKFLDNVDHINGMSEALSYISDGKDAVEDYVKELSNFLALRKVKTERIDLLKQARDVASKQGDSDFTKAADSLLKVMEGQSFEYIEGKSIQYLWGTFLDVCWDTAKEGIPVLAAVDLDKAAVDALFDTSSGAENDLKLAVLYLSDSYFRQGLFNAAHTYRKNRNSVSKAQTFLACLEAYTDFQIYGITYANEWIENVVSSGLAKQWVEKIFFRENLQTAQDLKERSQSQITTRENYLSSINKYREIYYAMWNSKGGTDGTQESGASNVSTRDIVLTLDVSGSMAGTPLDETKIASEKFIDTILEQTAGVGLVTYADEAEKKLSLTQNARLFKQIVSSLSDGGGTNIEAGLSEAQSVLMGGLAKKKIVVLMSDGEPNDGKVGEELIEYARQIKESGTTIYTLGFFESLGEEAKAQAQYLMEKIASDGCHYEVANADDLRFFFGDMADQINGQKYIYVRIACPVDVSVTYNGQTLDSSESNQNLRTDFGTITFENESDEETNAEYEDDNTDSVKILRLKDGADYDLKLYGTGMGSMDYTIGFMDDEGNYNDLRRFNNIRITSWTTIDTVAANADESILNIDEDGDGKYDLRLRAEQNGVGEEVRTNQWIKIILICAGLIISVDVVVIVIIRKKKRRREKG